MNIIEGLKECNLTISTAESITGGEIASTICSIPGASNYFKGGVVSYTKEAKCSLLGLKMEDIEKYGVYSKETVISMAEGIKTRTNSNIAIATSGVAGPGSDEGVEAGTVYFCYIIDDYILTEKKKFEGDRNKIRKDAANYSLGVIVGLLTKVGL
jgi:PncC family amidohydrolase